MSHLLLLTLLTLSASPIHLWHEPEWFPGVEGSFNYWTGTQKPTGKWGIAGPGISAEWTQGGESGWNSIGAVADEIKAECGRDIIIPRAGKYRVWTRFVEHRRKRSPFLIKVGDKAHLVGEKPTLPIDDEYLLYWGFTFTWDSFDVVLKEGTVPLKVIIDRKGEAWRQVDAILLTTDLKYVPHGREKPQWKAYRIEGTPGQVGRDEPKLTPRIALGGKAFTLWTGVEGASSWWDKKKPESLRLIDLLHEHGPMPDIRVPLKKQWPKAEDVPLIGFPHMVPGLYLGGSPDLSQGSPLRKWLDRTKQPFYMMTNYASGNYNDKSGPATYAALTGPLKDQFLGYIHGEALGTTGVPHPEKPLGKTRAEHLVAFEKHLKSVQGREWSKIYKTKVDESHWARGIPCLSVDSMALCHFFYEMGSEVVGYELDCTMPNIPLRMAFLRGAARQYGKPWINYASGNFGDACNYFSQEPQVPRGAKSWFHSKYAVTDGVTAGWYRALYHLNYTGGASAIFWEQGMGNQWILPQPGTHPIQLSPFGRGTEDFMKLVEKGPAPGELVTPVAFLLSHAHGWEPTNYRCRMLHHFQESLADCELRELFNVTYSPVGMMEGKPASPYVQSMPPGRFGNSFDVLVDRPTRIKSIRNYPVVYAAGDVQLGPVKDELKKHAEDGGIVVVNINAAKGLPKELVGLAVQGKRVRLDRFLGEDVTPYEVEDVKLLGAKALYTENLRPLATRHAVGKGMVIVTLIPGMMGLDERAHPMLPALFDEHLVRPPARVAGDLPVLWQTSRNKDGLLLTILNPHGVDKTQNGVARVDRRAVATISITTTRGASAARYDDGKMVPLDMKESRETSATTLKIGPGSLVIVQLTSKNPKNDR